MVAIFYPLEISRKPANGYSVTFDEKSLRINPRGFLDFW
jgi:hypothetical protein